MGTERAERPNCFLTASTFTATSYEEVLHEQTPADKAAVFFCRHANGG